MRIQRITLRHFRGVDELDVALDADGVTVLEGENEIGKTSLAEALRYVFEYADSSTAEKIRQAQPVGRDVGPEVSVELTTGPYRATYTKRWLRRPATTLVVHSPRREHLTGRDAHDRMERILDETLDRTLWAALQVAQDSGLDAVKLDVPSLGRALDLTAGSSPTTDHDDALWDRICEERDRYWTETGRARAPRPDLERQVAAAQTAVQEVDARIAQVELQVERMAELEVEEAELARRLAGAEARATDLGRQAGVAAAMQAEVAKLGAEHKAAQAELDRWTQVAEARVALLAAVTSSREQLEEAQAGSASDAPALAQAIEDQAAAEEAHHDATQALSVAEAHHELAMADEVHRRREIEVDQAGERLARVKAERGALQAATAVLEAVTVDAAAVDGIAEAELALVRAEAAADAGASVITVTGLDDLVVELGGNTVELTPGEVARHRVGTAFEVVVPGAVQITFEPGAGEQERAERVELARTALVEACRRAGVPGADEARRQLAAREEAERVQRDSAARIRHDLRDLTEDELTRKVARLATKVAAYEAERPALPPLPDDHQAAQEAAARATESLAAARATHGRTAAALAAATHAATEAEQARIRRTERIEVQQAALARHDAHLTRERAEQDDDAVHEGLRLAHAGATAAAEALTAAEARFGAMHPADVQEQAHQAQAEVERHRRALEANRREADRLRGELDVAGDQGLAHRRQALETDRQRLQRDLAALDARAAAARLLHQVVTARRSEVRNRYAEPLRAEIERLGRLVFGPTLEVELDAELRIARRTLEGTTVAFDQLSAGAREQLGLVARLACAAIVAPEGGAPVVFDDALGWTDPTRLDQMGAAIADAGRHCQVIVLSCTPGRFRAVRGATTVRLGPPRMTLFDLDAG